jgi:hypothetical protein
MKYKVFISGFDTLTKNIVAILLVAVVFAACVKDKDYVLDPLSAPVITQVTSSQPPDSVLTAIYPGQTVVLKGSGFVGTQKITFDNHAADFNGAFFSDTTAYVVVPTNIPFGTLTPDDLDKITITNAKGSFTYAFSIRPSAPLIEAIDNEFALVGDTMLITGKYLYLLDSVVFPSGVKAAFFQGSGDGTWAKAIVPAGGNTTAGYLKIYGKGGASTSSMGVVVYDVPHVICDMDSKDAYQGGWGKPYIITENAGSYPGIENNGTKYLHMKGAGTFGPDSWWIDESVMPLSGWASVYPNDISDNESKANLAIKFEVAVPGTINTGRLNFKPNWNDGDGNNWRPWWNASTKERTPYTTGGKWRTITLPLATFNGWFTKYGDFKNKDLIVILQNPSSPEAIPMNGVDMAFDNIRIVKVN